MGTRKRIILTIFFIILFGLIISYYYLGSTAVVYLIENSIRNKSEKDLVLVPNYIVKDDKKLYVRSSGMAREWNGKFLEAFLKKIHPDKNIVYDDTISNPDIFLVSHFPVYQDFFPYLDRKSNVITWSGESHRVRNYDKNAYINFISQKPEKKSDLWFPYLLTSHYETLTPETSIQDVENENPIEKRKRLVAYISSNCIKEREELFSLLSKKSKTAHGLGKCSNNYKKAGGGWENLTDIYKNYIFGFSMENCIKEGYITEKIWNIYKGGAIPIFWGDSKSAEFFFNKETYIDVNDFDSLNDAAEYIFNLSLDKKKLREIKSKPILNDPKIFTDINYAMKKVFKRYSEEK